MCGDRIPEAGRRIFRKSFRIIEEELEGSLDLPAQRRSVLLRVLHATADFEFRDLLRFRNDPVKNGVRALRSGAPIVTDTHMVRAGIRDDLVEALEGNLVCRIKEKKTRQHANQQNTTCSRAAFERSREKLDRGIAVVGMAPTALDHLVHTIREERIRPEVVIGVPVGFVGAADSKKRLANLSVPSIYTKGRKGGSPVAAAVVNALLDQARRDEQADHKNED